MRSYSSRLLMWACLLNSAGGSNLRCSFRIESMFGPWVSTTALSAMMRTSTRRNCLSSCQNPGHGIAGAYSTQQEAGCDFDHADSDSWRDRVKTEERC